MKRTIYDDQLLVITGAAGFIGANIVRHLNEKGFQNLVLVDDFHTSDKWKNLVGTRFVELVSRSQLFDWLNGREHDIEGFVHLGACSDTTETDGDFLIENNYRYSVRLAEYALHHEHRFVYASSAATYGRGEQGFSDEHELIDTLRPINLYAYSKHIFDQWIKRQGVLDTVVGLKYFNIFGPYEQHKGRMASMVYHMTNSILSEGKVRLFQSTEPDTYKDGEQQRDFLYVKDAADMTCYFLENTDIGGIFNCGMGTPHTWNSLANAVFAALGVQPNIEYIPMPEKLAAQYQNYTCADMAKYCSVRPERPSFTSIDSACREYIQHHLVPHSKGIPS